MASRSFTDRESFWRELIDKRKAFQLTVDEVCEQAGVSRPSFYHWQRRLCEGGAKRRVATKPPTPLVPIQILDDRTPEITLELPGEIRLRIPSGCDEQTLAGVLRLLLAARGAA